jgi:hypothetical protein
MLAYRDLTIDRFLIGGLAGKVRHEEPATRQVEFAGTTLNLARSIGDQRAEEQL